MSFVILLMKPLSLQFPRIPVEGHSNLQHHPRLQTPVTKECKDSEEHQANSFEKKMQKAGHQESGSGVETCINTT
jgi:hypothetical protein